MNFNKGLKWGRLIWTLFVTWYFINFSRNFINSIAADQSRIPNTFFLILILWMVIEYYFASPFFQSGIVAPPMLERIIFSIFFYASTVYCIADYTYYHWTQLNFLSPVLNIIGIVIFLIGVLLRFLTLYQLLQLPAQKLPKSGWFNICRHPRYLATSLQIISIPLVFSSYLGLLLSILIGLPIIYLVMKAEEKKIHNQFGEEYAQYQTNVPFIIPKLSRISISAKTDKVKPKSKK